jgi:hypothetical protein
MLNAAPAPIRARIASGGDDGSSEEAAEASPGVAVTASVAGRGADVASAFELASGATSAFKLRAVPASGPEKMSTIEFLHRRFERRQRVGGRRDSASNKSQKQNRP